VSQAPTSTRPLSGSRLLRNAALLAGVSLAAAAACSLIGVAEVHWPLWSSSIWVSRLLRLAAAAVVGSGLAAAGLALQGMLRNPLAEPYILGISSGAGVGVLVGMAVAESVGLRWASAPVLAILGALVTSAVVYGIAQRRGRLDPYVLLLSGVIVNVFNGALMLGILLFLSPNALLTYFHWAMGTLSDATDGRLLVFCIACAAGGWAVLLLRGAAFNALGLGDEVASSSGVAVHWLRVETFVVVSVMTAAAVALAGPVGFVGLIVPHICRLILGPDHRRLVIYSGFVGAIFLMVADTLCRTVGYWLQTSDIPVGMVTALSGGPFFICLLRRRSREGGV
jgi:iron complex transport system permease protein